MEIAFSGAQFLMPQNGLNLNSWNASLGQDAGCDVSDPVKAEMVDPGFLTQTFHPAFTLHKKLACFRIEKDPLRVTSLPVGKQRVKKLVSHRQPVVFG